MSAPAFPFVAPGYEPEGGLTKRELFAAMAMQGMCAGQYWGGNVDKKPELHKPIAEIAVLMADALLAELAE